MKLSDLSSEDKLELLQSLSIEAEITTKENYIGGADGSGRMYEKSHTLNLRLLADIDDEIHTISETELYL